MRRRRMWPLSLVVAAAFLAQPALADGLGIGVDAVDVSQFPQVRTYVSVTSANGATVTGLNAQAFQVQEDGKPVDNLTAEPVGQTGEPISTALVIDVSGSMGDQQKLDKTVEAANAFVDQLGTGERATVVAYSSRVTVIQDYTDDKTALKTALDSLVAKGNRVLYDAVAQTARRQAVQTQQRRKPIILLTDGEDTNSSETLDASIAAAKAASTSIYAIGLGSGAKKETLDQLAAKTGGQAIYISEPAELKATFLSIGDQLRRQYVLRYTSKLAVDTKPHGLAVGVTSAGQQVTGLQSFVIPGSSAATEVPVVAATAQVAPTTSVPATTPAPAATPAPVAAAVSPPVSVDATVLGLALLLLLIVGVAVWFLASRQGPAPAPPATMQPQPAPLSPPPTDTTEVVGMGARADPEATAIRPGPGGAAGATVVRFVVDKQRPPARLLITRRGEESVAILEQPVAIVGRDDDVSIPIKDSLASRQHAKIVREGDHYWIEDLHSLNGTQVNGETVTRRQLVSNDHIGIGETVLTFVVDTQ